MMGLKTFKAAVPALVLLGLAGCQEADRQLSQSNRHNVPISPAMMATLSEKGVSARAPMLIRAYKKESELEVWKANAAGEYVLVKTFPMCRWSGQLGPKKVAGDRQVPEGFYTITPGQMNPNSSYYLSFNVGYPNAYDQAHGYTGSAIMVHGACSSMGCFSMTDQQIADIYALTREAFAGGQRQIQMQSFPFRFSPDNLAKYRADPNMPFWKMLKEGSDSFDVTRREARVSICDRKYVFNRSGGACAPDAASPVVQAVAAKARADEAKVAELAPRTPPVRKIYGDGDQHESFRHRYSGDMISQPQALGGVEVAVADVVPVAVAAASRPAARTANATPRAIGTPVPTETAAFAEQTASSPSFFRKWLGGDQPAAPAATTAEAARPAAAKPKPAAKAAKPADKTADAAAVLPAETTILGAFTASIANWR